MTHHRLAYGVSALFALQTAVAQIPPPADAPKPLAPEVSAAAFKLSDGFRMELVASEPLIASPSGVCWDEGGRMFVSELHGYNLEGQLEIEELNKSGKLDTEVRRVQAADKFKNAAEAGTYGVVKLLSDTDGDGRMDQAEIWATNLPPAYGLVPARGGVIVACAPHIVFLADRDGDGRAEVREKLFTGFRTGVLERGVNAPMWGFDGWIYFGRGHGGGKITGPNLATPVDLPGSDFRIRSDGSAIEPVTGSTHTFGFAMTETGDRFVVNTINPGIYVAPLPWRYLVRNPNAATPSIEAPTGDRRAYSMSQPHPWRQRRADDPSYFKFYRDRYGASDSDAAGWFTSASSPLVYLDHALPGLHGQYFVCEPSGNLIHRAVIERDGSVLKLRRAPGEERSEFAASDDPWSHPMALTHGPDGALWVVDYYREIIEDYSAIPRYLQQQYGLYAGHDRGRIYRLTHRDSPKAPPADMSALDVADLARECASPLLWRRATAQRLLIEGGARATADELRELLTASNAQPLAIITALRTLDSLKALQPADLRPFLRHTNSAVRVHALQLGDQWFALEQGRELLEETLGAAVVEQDPRVLIQFALSLGEARDDRAFAMLARFARERLDIRWMDAAVLSSLAQRGADMLAELQREPGNSGKFLSALAKSVAASGDAKGARNSTDSGNQQPTIAPAEPVSEETFRKFIAALREPRDLKRGREIFLQACAMCHRLGNDGYNVGPDLLGQLAMPEESLLQEILAPSERIRPGYETTLVKLRDGSTFTGILKDDGATSLTLLQAGGLEQVLLRKDVAEAQRLSTSLMSPLAEGLTPTDTANLLAWLKSNLSQPSDMSPQHALAAFSLEPGLRIELVAAEPVVVDPVAMAFDEEGRIYVAENRDYPTGPAKGNPPDGRIALLQDKDGDGVFETRSEVATGLAYPNGVMPWKGGVFVTCAPDLLYFKDSDGSGKPDERKVVLTGFSTNSTTQLRVSHPTFGLDNWIYLTSGLGTGGKIRLPGKTNVIEFKTDSRFNPLTGEFEPLEGRAQFGMTFDSAGHRFICMNRVHVQHVVMPWRYLKRNPHITISEPVQNCPEAMTPEPLKGHGAAARIYPISEHITTADSHEGTFTAACAVFVYRGDALPAEYRDNVFACEPTGNLVHRDLLSPKGSTFTARRAREGVEFLASTDTWFRPVHLASGPDGALYICDMYRKTVEHPEYLPQEIRKRTDFESGKGMGRIYRVTGKEFKSQISNLKSQNTKSLCDTLSSSNGWTRDTAHRLLVERNDSTAIATLKRDLHRQTNGLAALHQLHVLNAFDALDENDLKLALRHPFPPVREHALQLSERFLPGSKPLAREALKLASDPDARVRFQAALSLSGTAALAGIAARDANDPWTRLAVFSSATGRESELLSEMVNSLPRSDGVGRFSLLAELGQIIGKSQPPEGIRKLVEVISKCDSNLQLAALSGIVEGQRTRGSRLGGSLALPVAFALQTATNDKANLVLRQSAITLLSQGDYHAAGPVLLRLLQGLQPPNLQIAAVRSLARFDSEKVMRDLFAPERWKLYTPAIREAVLNNFLSDARHLPTALSVFESDVIPPSVVDANRRKQLLQHKDETIRSRAEALFKSSQSSNRQAVYEDWKSVLSLTPSSLNGRTVFKQHCATCHRLDREGVPVGPDLFSIRNQPKEAILLHIIIPEQEVAPGFTAYDVETTDGRTLSGLIASDTPTGITLRSGLGIEETISRENIATISSQGLSLMPQEAEKNMSRQDMADLLAYLKGE